jgi:hypothetical protein
MKSTKPYYEKSIEGLLKNTSKTDGGCLIWKGAKGSNGYAHAIIGGKYVIVSRYVLQSMTEDKKPKSIYACHTCDNPSCINPSHLFWGTNKENIKDAQSKGRFRIAKHGTRSRYVSGCKCRLCLDAEAEYARKRRGLS